jgi:hypothetical protein
MIRREVGIGESHDALEILLVDLAEQPRHTKRVRRVELCPISSVRVTAGDMGGTNQIIDRSLETRGIVGEGQLANVGVGRLEREAMRESLTRVRPVDAAHKVGVVLLDRSPRQEFVDSRVGHRVEVSADDSRDLGTVRVVRRGVVALGEVEARGEASKVVANLVQLVHEHRDLHQLDVAELGVPSDVRVGDDEAGPRVAVLEERDDGDVVLRHDPVEHVLRLLEVRSAHRDLVELDELLLHQCEP